MLNNVVLVGRLTKDPEVINTEKGNKRTVITLAVSRAYKNYDGQYDTDFINIILWNGIAENTCEYCKKGDVIGIKGRIESRTYQDQEDNTKYITEIIAEKVTFLSSNNQKKADE